MPDASHYSILGLASNASVEQIRQRFHELAHRHHPDHHSGDQGSEARFLLVLNAWKVLGNAATKSEYDQWLRRRSAPASPKPPKDRPARTSAADEVRESLNSLLWDIEDLVRRGGPVAFQKDVMRILVFLDQWVLEPAGYCDFFMEARGLERLNPSSYIDFLVQGSGRLNHFPFTSVENYYFNLRLRMNRYLDKLDRLPWLEPLPGKAVRFVDALVEAQNLAVHYLAALRATPGGGVPRFTPSHPDFH
jgi:hypothetical protein